LASGTGSTKNYIITPFLGYQVIRFTGKMFNMGEDLGHCFIGVGEPIATPMINSNLPFKSQTFQTTHSADFKCVCVDER
jgi:hypothetical protein